jgi:hypothetical protein
VTANPEPALFRALAALAAGLSELSRPFMVIGGIAVIARGVPRQTIDIDATVAADGLDMAGLIDTLLQHGIAARIPNAAEFARQRQVLLLRHLPTGTPLDLSLAWLPFEADALGRATAVDFGGVQIPVVSVDDLIVLKAVAWRTRDRGDIERLLALHRKTVDITWIRDTVRQFYDVLDEPERLAEFDALSREALASS